MATSKAVPCSNWGISVAAGPDVKDSLFSVAFSYCGPSSSRTDFNAVELNTFMSAAFA
jgi:hypothetical protein